MELQDEIKSKPTIIIHACDKYEWIFPEFLEYFNKNFPYQLDWPIYFCTEELTNIDLPTNIQLYPVGTGSWSERLRRILCGVDNDTILYIQEDFFILNCNKHMLYDAYKIHKKYDLDITKLATNYEFSVRKNPHCTFYDLPIYHQTNGDYLMSHQPIAFFKKSFLLDTLIKLKGDYGPSEHEINTTKRINLESNNCIQNVPSILCLGPVFVPNKSIILTIHHAIIKGQYNPI